MKYLYQPNQQFFPLHCPRSL